MMWLVYALVFTVLGLTGLILGMRAGELRRDAEVAAAVRGGMPEVTMRLVGGPFDGSYMDMSPGLGEQVASHQYVVVPGGRYALVGDHPLSDGGRVAVYEWVAA